MKTFERILDNHISDIVQITVTQKALFSPLLFAFVMETVTPDIKRSGPYLLLDTDEVFLALHKLISTNLFKNGMNALCNTISDWI